MIISLTVTYMVGSNIHLKQYLIIHKKIYFIITVLKLMYIILDIPK